MLMNLRKKLTNQKGFTLIELMVVIAIIGILAAIAIPKMSSATDSAKIAKIQADLRTISGAEAIYYSQQGSYTSDMSVLVSAGLLASTVTPPTSGGATSYTLSATTGEATYVFSGKTYSSNGTATNVTP